VGGAEWRVCAGTRGPSVHSAFAQGEFQWPLARHLRGERIHQHLGPGNWRASTHDATRPALRAPAFMHRKHIILPNIMQVANVLQDDKRAGQASLCIVQTNTKARGTTQAQRKGQSIGTTARIRPGQALGATWNRGRRFACSNHPHVRADLYQWPNP